MKKESQLLRYMDKVLRDAFALLSEDIALVHVLLHGLSEKQVVDPVAFMQDKMADLPSEG